MRVDGDDRAVSPVVGVLLMVGIVVLLASVFAVQLFGFGAKVPRDPVDSVTDDVKTEDRLSEPYTYGNVIRAADPDAGETTAHIVTVNITGNAVGNSLNQVTIDYNGGETDVGDTAAGSGLSSLATIGIDTDDDGYLETNAMDDVEASDFEATNNGHTLVVELTGNYQLDADDQLVLVYRSVDNPDTSGSYDVDVDVNGDRVYDGTLTVG